MAWHLCQGKLRHCALIYGSKYLLDVFLANVHRLVQIVREGHKETVSIDSNQLLVHVESRVIRVIRVIRV
jgi:hypothetical protein